MAALPPSERGEVKGEGEGAVIVSDGQDHDGHGGILCKLLLLLIGCNSPFAFVFVF